MYLRILLIIWSREYGSFLVFLLFWLSWSICWSAFLCFQETDQVEYMVPEKTSLAHHLVFPDPVFIDFLKYLLQTNPQRRPTAIPGYFDIPNSRCCFLKSIIPNADVTEPLLIEVDQIYHLACPASPLSFSS